MPTRGRSSTPNERAPRCPPSITRSELRENTVNPRRIGVVYFLLSLLLVLAACGGSSNDASPTARSNSTSATAASNAQPVSFADAYQKLVDQQSFVMTAELS